MNAVLAAELGRRDQRPTNSSYRESQSCRLLARLLLSGIMRVPSDGRKTARTMVVAAVVEVSGQGCLVMQDS